MKISNGTPRAEALLERLKKSGNLVDVYSAEFFERQPTFQEAKGNALFYRDGMNEVEYAESGVDNTYDCAPKNHLLFMRIDRYDQETLQELCAIYEPFQRQFAASKHKPNFVILNLYTKQALCVGLGRKNRLFTIDAESDKSINIFGMSDADSAYMQKFTSNDLNEATYDFLYALSDLGSALKDFDEEPSKKNQKSINEAVKTIKIFFPEIDYDELNSGDYL